MYIYIYIVGADCVFYIQKNAFHRFVHLARTYLFSPLICIYIYIYIYICICICICIYAYV